MGHRFVYVFLMVLIFSSPSLHLPATAQEPVFFKNVNVFDGETKIAATNVLISGGKIKAIGAEVVAIDGAKIIDGTGKTLAPGLIDCHTHVWFDTQLQQAAIFGVTTELDMMSAPENAARLRQEQSDGSANNRADFFSAGAAVTVKEGHGTQFGFPVPTVDDAAGTAQFVTERVREGSDYIKIIYENGSAYGFEMPTINAAIFAAAVKTAHEGDKLAVAHVSTLDGGKLALESDVDGLVHLFADAEITPEIIELAKSNNVFVVPTASVVSNTAGANLTKLVVNDDHLKPYLNNENLGNLSRTFPQRAGQKSSWDNLKNNISKLHAAGVPILAGTDAPNPGTVHGASMQMEIQLLTQCGMSNEQALAAATSVPAKHFQLTDRGRVAEGLRADLVLFEGDPTADIKQVSQIAGVWKGGFEIDREARAKLVKAEQDGAGKMEAAAESRLISDFEGENVTSEFGAGWAASTDVMMGGKSKCEIKITEGGAAETKQSLQVSGNTQERQPAFSGVMFAPGAAQMQPANISGHAGLSFWAKGNGETRQVMLFNQKRGFQPSTKTFAATKEWTQYNFKITDFDGCDGTDVIGIWFGTNEPGDFQFQIDQVQLEK